MRKKARRRSTMEESMEGRRSAGEAPKELRAPPTKNSRTTNKTTAARNEFFRACHQIARKPKTEN